MPSKAVIIKGDPTMHGGKVLEGFSQVDLKGIPVSGVGHLVSCPMCKGVFPIVEGAIIFDYYGVSIAVEGLQTTCGARLIATQKEFCVDG